MRVHTLYTLYVYAIVLTLNATVSNTYSEFLRFEHRITGAWNGMFVFVHAES